MSNARGSIYLLPLVLGALGMADDAAAQSCPTMRKINIGVSVAPPNVVHTSPYVAKDLGFFAKGMGGPGVMGEGAERKKVVINPSGGLLSKGHPTGATGCGQLYEAVMQLRGRHANQAPKARLGLTHNGGGTAAAVSVHILEAVS